MRALCTVHKASHMLSCEGLVHPNSAQEPYTHSTLFSNDCWFALGQNWVTGHGNGSMCKLMAIHVALILPT